MKSHKNLTKSTLDILCTNKRDLQFILYEILAKQDFFLCVPHYKCKYNVKLLVA